MNADSDQRSAELEREIARLEAANAELRRVNARLAGNRAAKLDSAAASALSQQHAGPGVGQRLRSGAKSRLRALALRIMR